MTYDILQYLNSFVGEAIAAVIAESGIPVLDLATEYRKLADTLRDSVNAKAIHLGIAISEAVIENISLPQEVEKFVDEQSGLGLASKDMDTYMQYQTVRAMRDASKQKGGLAGLGAGMAFANRIGNTAAGTSDSKSADNITKLKEYKELLDAGIITQEEFDALKKQFLKL